LHTDAAVERTPTIRTTAMPADTNPADDIFGGWLMAQMDLAAGNVAARRARGRCATIAVNGMVFHNPVRVGDEVTCFADVVSVGRTSMRIKVKVLATCPRQRGDEAGHRSDVHLRRHRRQRPPATGVAGCLS
jgi:acyl-CoA thioesterase YciA